MRPEECGCCPAGKGCPKGGGPMVDQCNEMSIYDQIMTYYANTRVYPPVYSAVKKNFTATFPEER
jgi:hypothetical protein